MRTADGWKDYRLLDASDGERLESWSGIRLIRPDPQVIWKTEKSAIWQSANAVYHRSNKGGGQWEYLKKLPESWTVGYSSDYFGSLKFKVHPTGFKHTGLFPEQAVNWEKTGQLIAERKKTGKVRVLNLFAYTGGATLACSGAGAEVCHVDASKGMVQWARENASLSGLSEKPIRWIVDDCEKFVRREIKRESRYEGVIMDPPSYGRGPQGEIWKLEDNVYDLVKLTAGVLSQKPLFFVLNSYTTGLSASVMGYILSSVLVPKFGGRVESDEIGLPVESTGLTLPAGSTAMWYAG